MSNFQQLVQAAQFKIVGGSSYQWESFGKNARFLDFETDKTSSINLSVVFDAVTQELYQSTLYVNDKSYRWTAPIHLEGFRQESFQKNIDPRVAYDSNFYCDCDVFEDFVSKVNSAFINGTCNNNVLIPIHLSPEDEEIFSLLPDGTDLSKFILDSGIEAANRFQKQNTENWDILFSTLLQKNILATVDNEFVPLSKSNIQEVYDWISSLSTQEVHLTYSDKETAKGILSTLKTDNGETFQYQYKK